MSRPGRPDPKLRDTKANFAGALIRAFVTILLFLSIWLLGRAADFLGHNLVLEGTHGGFSQKIVAILARALDVTNVTALASVVLREFLRKFIVHRDRQRIGS